jgi:hypothetical protein
MRRFILSAGAAFAAAIGLGAATTASAALVLGGTACGPTDITPAASACRGWYQGNLNSGNATDKADSATALNALLGVASYTGPTLSWLENFNVSGNTVNFTNALFGDTVVSFHVGAAVGAVGGVGYNGTAFFRFDAGNFAGGLDTFSFNRAGLSNARLYYTGKYVPPAVPEPATWAMMLFGLGFVGFTLRRRAAVSFV